MSADSARKALKALLKQPPTNDELKVLTRELEQDGPRGAATIGAAAVENVLKDAIVSRLRKGLGKNEIEELFGIMKPLGSFSARIRIGFAIGIYGEKTRDDLDLLREIRNAFAHSRVPIDFKTPAIVALCDNFNCAPDRYFALPSARKKFESAVQHLFIHLWQIAGGTASDRISHDLD